MSINGVMYMQEKVVEALAPWQSGLLVLDGRPCCEEEVLPCPAEQDQVVCDLYPRHKVLRLQYPS